MLYKFRNKLKFSTDLFMDNVRALESYHRYTHNNTRIPEEEYNLKIKKILDTVNLDQKDIEWLSQKLKYGNEPSLNMRLKELIKENQNSYIKEKLKTYKNFCQAVADNRNFYTHYDKELEKKALRGGELFDINQKVEGILYSCIFKELGFDNTAFEKGLKYHLDK